LFGEAEQMGEMRNAYKILARKPKGRRPFGTPMHRLASIISMEQSP
jgi:hypothetical protein